MLIEQPPLKWTAATQSFPADYFAIEKLKDVNSNGSVRLYQGTTIVVASVYGPNAISAAWAPPLKGVVKTLIKTSEGLDKNYVLSLESHLKHILEGVLCLNEYPRMEIEVNFWISTNNGGLLSSLINAGVVALLHNGLSLRNTVFSLDFLINSETRSLSLQNSLEQKGKQKKEEAVLNITFDINDPQEIVSTQMNGHDFIPFAAFEVAVKDIIVPQADSIKGMLKTHLSKTCKVSHGTE